MDNFWTATVIAISTFYLRAAYVHIANITQTRNMAPGNALYIDILIPIILICLLVAYNLTKSNKIAKEFIDDLENPKVLN